MAQVLNPQTGRYEWMELYKKLAGAIRKFV